MEEKVKCRFCGAEYPQDKLDKEWKLCSKCNTKLKGEGVLDEYRNLIPADNNKKLIVYHGRNRRKLFWSFILPSIPCILGQIIGGLFAGVFVFICLYFGFTLVGGFSDSAPGVRGGIAVMMLFGLALLFGVYFGAFWLLMICYKISNKWLVRAIKQKENCTPNILLAKEIKSLLNDWENVLYSFGWIIIILTTFLMFYNYQNGTFGSYL